MQCQVTGKLRYAAVGRLGHSRPQAQQKTGFKAKKITYMLLHTYIHKYPEF